MAGSPGPAGDDAAPGPDGAGSGDPPPYVPLPSDLTEPAYQARAVFDTIADLYDRARPGYPPEAVADLRAAAALGPGSAVLEIGCGTGQLTADLAAAGARVRCVEAGPALAEVARRNLAGFAQVQVTTATFEAFEDPDPPAGGYDAVVSATAFHWIDPSLSYPKTARLLGVGGHLVLLSNTHGAGGTHTSPELLDPIRDLHRRLAPQVGEWTFPTAEDIGRRAGAGGDLAAVWSRIERSLWEVPSVSGWFDAPVVATYPWLARYDTAAYLAMLASQSSYALMDPGPRADLFDGIGRLVADRLDGVVTKEYVTVVGIARRTAAPVSRRAARRR